LTAKAVPPLAKSPGGYLVTGKYLKNYALMDYQDEAYWYTELLLHRQLEIFGLLQSVKEDGYGKVFSCFR
jgi:hypothetical protein